jgi:hypothetical protein
MLNQAVCLRIVTTAIKEVMKTGPGELLLLQQAFSTAAKCENTYFRSKYCGAFKFTERGTG